MKKQLIYLLFLITSSLFYGQKKNYQQKITEARVNFIIEELNLNSKQIKNFIPLHNDFRQQMFSLSREKNTLQKKVYHEVLDEKQAQNLLLKIEKKEKLIYLNRIKFNENVKNILTFSQILKLRTAEIKFKKKLLEKIRKQD